MKLRVKILQGEEFPIEVRLCSGCSFIIQDSFHSPPPPPHTQVETDSMTVLELKKSLESRVNASAELISLVFLGRVLNGTQYLWTYMATLIHIISFYRPEIYRRYCLL